MRTLAQSLLRWEWLVLLLLIPVTLLPFGPASALVVVIPVLWLVRKVATGRWLTPTPYDLAVWLLLVMVGLSFIVTFDPATSGPKIAGILLGIALLYGSVAYSRGARGPWPIVAFLLSAGTLMAVVGLIGAQWLPPFDFLAVARVLLPSPGGIPGAVDGVINGNELAGALSWVLPLMLGCLLGSLRHNAPSRGVMLALLAPAILFIGFIIVATSSRGGILAAGLGLLLVLAFYVGPRWRIVQAIGLTMAFVALIAYTGSRLDQNIVGDAIGLTGRVEIWARGLTAIADFPLTGVGVNGFRRVVHVLYPLYTIAPDVDLGHAHNHLLQTALDLGLPGLVAYVAIWFISAGLIWRTYRRLHERRASYHPYYGLVAGLAGSLLAGWVFGLFDAISLGARPGFLWWLLIGLTAAVHYAVAYSGESLRRRHRRQSFDYRSPVTTPAAPQAASPAGESSGD